MTAASSNKKKSGSKKTGLNRSEAAAAGGIQGGAKHDSPFPEAFCAFMLQHWQKPKGKLPAPIPGATYFAMRRKELSKKFPNDVLVVPTGHELVRSNDTHFPFRPGSDFYYLTGNLEPDCVLVMVPKTQGRGHDCLLFVEPNPGREETTFFTDRVKGELWVGPRLGIVQSEARFGLPCLPLEQLGTLMQRALSGAPQAPLADADAAARTQGRRAAPRRAPAAAARGQSVCRIIAGMDAALDAQVRGQPQHLPAHDQALAEALGDMRLIKDAHELRALRRACDSTRRGFEDVIERLHVAKSEREVEGVFNLRARMEGNAVGYSTIAASGEHACVLHWSQNFGALRRQDLLLLDAGVEGHELYTADVTRTLPISGTFSQAQRVVYELVLEAQEAALKEVRPGRDFMAPHKAAMVVLAYGLERLGVLASAEEALAPANQFYKRYTLHGVSHMLGLDVHDCAQARNEVYRFGALKPGMVLTVEPGLYFQKDDLTVPRALRGIGVRIEDDVAVTATGYRMLSRLPRQADAVEAWMSDIWQARGLEAAAQPPKRARQKAPK